MARASSAGTRALSFILFVARTRQPTKSVSISVSKLLKFSSSFLIFEQVSSKLLYIRRQALQAPKLPSGTDLVGTNHVEGHGHVLLYLAEAA